ncbi:group 1 truncated hemoglobin [Chitinivorax sp. B]|uniref:group I truncated hemoglobin n=1 Tax=Chitinivorax sp. B TaxID=2502235 RepID=UPI0010F6FFAA|nr:group 1 truncated hemoglobin [Chitinivorax sp. B]
MLKPALLLCFAIWPCSQVVMSEPTLYERLGGEEGVAAIAHGVVEQGKRDPKTAKHFDKFNQSRTEKLIAQQLCSLTHGGCVYEGENMRVAHAGLNIREPAFYATVQHLRNVLDERGVGDSAKNQLLRILAPMKRQIVQTGAAPAPATNPKAD